MLSRLLLAILFILPASARLVSVSLIEAAPQIVLSAKADYSLVQTGKVLYEFDKGSETLIKANSVTNKNKTYAVNGEFSFESDDLFLVQGHKFRGSMIVRNGLLSRNEPDGSFLRSQPRVQETLQLINKLELEDYLKSVVSSEMPSRWPLEALKAQAVCARTYTLNTLQHKDTLQPGVADQMYLGYDREDDKGRKAVSETNGEVMLDGLGNYVDAYYSSSGGNYTASVSDTWGLSVRPYLLPVNDYAQGSSYQSWTREFTTSDLQSKLADLRLAEIQSITVFQRSIEGRATKVQILGSLGAAVSSGQVRELGTQGRYDDEAKVGSKPQWRQDTNGDIFDAIVPQERVAAKARLATRYLTGEELRHKLGLPSTNFQLALEGDKYIFTGTGFGHGIGMTQYGAKNMAEEGASYREILNHYYQGLVIKNLN